MQALINRKSQYGVLCVVIASVGLGFLLFSMVWESISTVTEQIEKQTERLEQISEHMGITTDHAEPLSQRLPFPVNAPPEKTAEDQAVENEP